jgi:hypothetical protein
MITLFLYFGTGQLSGPEDWLYAQLNSVPAPSISVSSVVNEMGANIRLLWKSFAVVAKSLFRAKILVITDEVHLLQAELFTFRRLSYKNRTSCC